MTNAHVIDGQALALDIRKTLSKEIASYSSRPGLATILLGDNPASKIYVANKAKAAAQVGIKSFQYQFAANTSEKELLNLIADLNQRSDIHGILVQLPLPTHLSEAKIIAAINPDKDVDGFHPLNLGYLLREDPKLVACTPLGIIYLINSVGYQLSGKHAVVIGRSNIVGKPLMHLLLQADATVSVCHVKTKNLSKITKTADLVISATGHKHLINDSHIQKGAFVIDVGISREHTGNIVGDVDFKSVSQLASYITPVPGGVGPLTIAMLLRNTLDIFKRGQR